LDSIPTGPATASEGHTVTERRNKPLDFKLKLDGRHPYLAERGLSPELVETFGLGYCRAGILQGRICIPIHDESGNLVAYAGRWAADDVPPGQPRYKVPPGFKRSSVLFNLHRIAGKTNHIVVVEGYWSVFRLHTLGVAAVALMGRSLSAGQEDLLVRSGAQLLTLLLDGDDPGRQATADILPRLVHRMFVRTPMVPDGEAPDSIQQRELVEAVQIDRR
jgi:DNA primase